MVSTFEEYTVNDDTGVRDDFLNETVWFAQSFTIGNTGPNLAFDPTQIKVKVGTTVEQEPQQ